MQKMRAQLHWWVLGLLCAGTFLVWYAVAAEDRAGKLTIAFLDVGQGDAIFIESPTGKQMLIDGGPDGRVMRQIGKVMPFYDRTIDMLMVTNPDKDHFAGFLDVLRAYQVGAVMEPGTTGASAEYGAFETLVEAEGAQKLIARRGQMIQLGGGTYFEVLFPDRDASDMATNDGSIMGRLVYGRTSVMFTGDAPHNIEHYLVSLDGKNLKSDALKVGHHGSHTSTSAEFAAMVSPSIAVISDGTNNTYGHPHQEVLDTFVQFSIPVHRTDTEGTIVLVSDGETLKLQK